MTTRFPVSKTHVFSSQLSCPLQKFKERVRPDFSMHLTCFLRIIRPLCRTCKKEHRNAIMMSSKREKEIRTHAKAHPQNNGLFVQCFGWPNWRHNRTVTCPAASGYMTDKRRSN